MNTENNNFKIGITERGDAGLDFSWRETFKHTDKRAILITKRISDEFIEAVMEEVNNGANLIIHATVTGLGGTPIEPNVPTPEFSLSQIVKLIEAGFPVDRIILRLDPIIPGYEDFSEVVLIRALKLGILQNAHCKVSVLDMYKHSRERFEKAGIKIDMPYFKASHKQFETINQMLNKYIKYGVKFTSCNEPDLTVATPAGCVDKSVCDIMGIDVLNTGVNPQGRGNCLCLCGCKTELLNNKKRCSHGCLYCYWKD